MKSTKYFNSQAELEAFYPDGVPSNVLAIVTSGESGEATILMTSSNNITGTTQEQGGEILNPETEARIDALEENKADKADTYTKTEVDELISASEPDLSYYVTKEALSGMSYATEAYVTSKIGDVVGAAPEALDTLKELADALNDDAQFASYVAVELGKKANSTDVYTKNEIQSMSYITSDALNGYATQAYVTAAINDIDIPDPDLSAYVSKTELDAMSYITTDALNGYATESYVGSYSYSAIRNATVIGDRDNYISNQYFSGSLTGTTYYRGGLRTVISTTSPSTKQVIYIDNDKGIFVTGIGGFNISNTTSSYTLSYVVNDNISRISALENAGYATEAYVTTAIAAIDIPDPDLSAYVTKNELDEMSYVTSAYAMRIVNVTTLEYSALSYEQKHNAYIMYNITDAEQYDIAALETRVTNLETAVGQAQQLSQVIVDGNNS